jgi:hypothetical protein
MTVAALKAVEPSINTSTTNGEAYMNTSTGVAVESGNKGYEVTATANNTEDKFTIKRNSSGEITRKCTGKSSQSGCVSSTW